MGKFSKIKKYNLKSLSIDEKIKFLDKEMEKTGLNEKMTTQGMYSIVQPDPGTPQETADVPNSSNIGGSGFNQSSAGSGTEGDAPTFSSTSDLFNSSANSTIFPSTNYGGKQGFGIVIGPSFGAGTTYGIIEGGNTYRAVLGGHLAGGTRGSNHYYQIYKAKADAPSHYGQDAIDDAKEDWQLAVQVEAALIEIGYDNTLFNVTWKSYRRPILFEDLTSYPSFAHQTKGTLYLVPFSMLGTANKYVTQPEIPPHNVVVREDDLGDPNFLGFNIDGLSPEAFKALLKKKKDEEERIARGKYTGADDPFWDDFVDGFPEIPAGDEDPNTRKGTGMGDRWVGPPVEKADASGAGSNDDEPYDPFANEIKPDLGAKPGDDLAFFGGDKNKNKAPKKPTKSTRKGRTDATYASTGMYPNMTPEIFKQKYGMSYSEYLALP